MPMVAVRAGRQSASAICNRAGQMRGVVCLAL